MHFFPFGYYRTDEEVGSYIKSSAYTRITVSSFTTLRSLDEEIESNIEAWRLATVHRNLPPL